MKKDLTPVQYYAKYKKIILPASFFILALFLVIGVVIPQFSTISKVTQDISEKKIDVDRLQASLTNISNQGNLQPDLDLVNRALPTSKNITSIFNALVSSANDSGVDVKDFSLKVGGVYGRAEKIPQGGVSGVPSIDVIVRVEGTSTSIIDFAKQVQTKLPIAEVAKVDAAGGVASFQISFFYKPQDLSALSRQETILPLTTSQNKTLQELKNWDE